MSLTTAIAIILVLVALAFATKEHEPPQVRICAQDESPSDCVEWHVPLR